MRHGTPPRGQRVDQAERAPLTWLLRGFPTARNVLEVGCGTGHFAAWLASQGWRVVGLDRAPAMLAEMRQHVAGLPEGGADSRRAVAAGGPAYRRGRGPDAAARHRQQPGRAHPRDPSDGKAGGTRDVHVHRARELGLKIAIDTDAHSVDHLRFMRYGIAQARRGWLEKRHVVNTMTWSEIRRWLQRRR
jgi:SAM-dependent methyltransferase